MTFRERLFPNTREVAGVCQRVLHRGRRDELQQHEQGFMISVLCRHPDWDLKRVWDVANVLVSQGPEAYRDYDCFWVDYYDGTSLDFSYRKCV